MRERMTTLKDYYHILAVDKSASPEEIKRAYRKLAVRHHPDHNPGDKNAEERFKEISEAYAVLIDAAKRGQYDQAMNDHGRERTTASARGFEFSQEDIFRDLFRDAYARQTFRDLARELQRDGVRFDERFFDHIFFGGRGFFFGGVFFSGPGHGRARRGPVPRDRTTFERPPRAQPQPVVSQDPGQSGGLLRRIGQGIRGLAQSVLGLPAGDDRAARDIDFNLNVTAQQAGQGTEIELSYLRNGRTQRVSVKVPPGTKHGAKLRLKRMGHTRADGEPGDLYLHVHISA